MLKLRRRELCSRVALALRAMKAGLAMPRIARRLLAGPLYAKSLPIGRCSQNLRKTRTADKAP